MKIKVNGKEEDIPSCTVHDYLNKKDLKQESVVVELNYKIVKREEWANVKIKENDNLEILRFVGGG